MPSRPDFKYEGLVDISDQAARASVAKKPKQRRPVDQACAGEAG